MDELAVLQIDTYMADFLSGTLGAEKDQVALFQIALAHLVLYIPVKLSLAAVRQIHLIGIAVYVAYKPGTVHAGTAVAAVTIRHAYPF